jgi:hypothetical protein
MSDAAIYHQNALKCYRLAGEAANDGDRSTWLAMGLRWLQRAHSAHAAQAAQAAQKLPPPAGETSELIIQKHKKKMRLIILPAQANAADTR